MLAGDFYIIKNLKKEVNIVKAMLEFNATHPIFTGHFPLQPVVPGVCMMQIIKELAEQVTGSRLNLIKAVEMKFLAIIDPLANNIIDVELKYAEDAAGKLNIVASLSKDALIHFKFKGSFIKQPTQ